MNQKIFITAAFLVLLGIQLESVVIPEPVLEAEYRTALEKAFRGHIVPACDLDPCRLLGDFDADGQKEAAVLVKKPSGPKGIVVLFKRRPAVMLGAGLLLPGARLGDDGDYSWIQEWQVRRKKQWADMDKPDNALSPAGDFLDASGAESSSGSYYLWHDGHFVQVNYDD